MKSLALWQSMKHHETSWNIMKQSVAYCCILLQTLCGCLWMLSRWCRSFSETKFTATPLRPNLAAVGLDAANSPCNLAFQSARCGACRSQSRAVPSCCSSWEARSWPPVTLWLFEPKNSRPSLRTGQESQQGHQYHETAHQWQSAPLASNFPYFWNAFLIGRLLIVFSLHQNVCSLFKLLYAFISPHLKGHLGDSAAEFAHDLRKRLQCVAEWAKIWAALWLILFVMATLILIEDLSELHLQDWVDLSWMHDHGS